MSLAPSAYRPVSAMMSTRWCLPGTNFWPAGPTPFLKPKLDPLLVTHFAPSGVSVTKGMRSLSSRGASLTNSSGGIQGMSRWQSAEILLYFIARLLVP